MKYRNKRMDKKCSGSESSGWSGSSFRYFFSAPVLFTPLQSTPLELHSIVWTEMHTTRGIASRNVQNLRSAEEKAAKTLADRVSLSVEYSKQIYRQA